MITYILYFILSGNLPFHTNQIENKTIIYIIFTLQINKELLLYYVTQINWKI